jgi:hypothetical protein
VTKARHQALANKRAKVLGSTTGPGVAMGAGMTRWFLSVTSFALLLAVAACGGSPDSRSSDPESVTNALPGAQPITLRASVTLFDHSPFGIAVCGSGIGLPEGSPVYVSYSGVPSNYTGSPAEDDTVTPFTSGRVLARVDDDTSYSFMDQEGIGGPDCSPDQLTRDVTVTVYTYQDSAAVPNPTLVASGARFAIGTIPAKYWCANGGDMQFNGGCP